MKMFFGLGVLVLLTGTYAGVIRLRSGSHNVNLGKDTLMADMPETMDMEVPVGDTMVEMKLTRSATISPNIPIMLGTDVDSFVLWKSDHMDDFVVYEDPERQASFVLWTGEKDSDFGHGMMGVFDNGDDTYSMEPMDSRQVSRQTRYYSDENEPVMVTMNGAKLSMTKVNRSELVNSDREQMISEEAKKVQQHMQDFLAQHAQGSINKKTFELELFVVIDYSVFTRWLGRSRSMDYMTREIQAINYIRYYFANVINGVGLRYKQVREHGNRIVVRPVAMYISKSAEASPWTELPSIKQEYHFNEAHDSLDEFARWANEKQKIFLPFDHAILFTANDLFSGYAGGRRQVINGLTNMMGICGEERFSVSHHGGLFSNIQTAVHQVAHSFGAYHDGYGSDCAKHGKYIMTAATGVADPNNIDQFSQFSSCSKRAFWDFLYYLTANRSNCLLERSNYATSWDSSHYEQKYSGQRYTADEQCMVAHGISSFHCDGDGTRDSSICRQLYCWVSINGMCEAFGQLAANDGTSCGNKQWCMKGECVNDDDAPTYDQSPCSQHHDVHGISDNQCFEIGIKEPHKCYDSNFKSSCCETCNVLFRDGDADVGCEYGDKDPAFCQHNFAPSHCYGNADRCCETCRRYMMEVTDCEYGDKSGDCDKAQETPSMCYAMNKTCCWTCPRIQIGLKGCEWGDKIRACDTLSKEECYNEKLADDCCDFCNQQQDGPVGCEWGDRISSCTKDDCHGDKREACCRTCNGISTTASVTTSTSTTSTSTTQASITTTTANQVQGDQLAFGVIDNEEIQELCEDRGQHCDEIRGGHDCYYLQSDCCRTCKKYETDDPICLYGDRMSWCARYVADEGTKICDTDPYIESECCASCGLALEGRLMAPLSQCLDIADWCQTIFPGQCYQPSTRKTCCAKCSSLERKERNCLFGDAYSWCSTAYCSTHRKECCKTCKKPWVVV